MLERVGKLHGDFFIALGLVLIGAAVLGFLLGWPSSCP